jgi:hypothetical protein
MSRSLTRILSWGKHVDPEPVVKSLFFFLIFFISLPVGAQTKHEREVLAISSRKFDWLVRRQADSLERVLDDRVQYIHSNGWVQTKREVLDDMRSGKLVYHRVTVKEAAVRVYGNAAVVTGLGTFEGVNGGNVFAMDLRYTEVYTLGASGWLLVSRHANRMP